ncbi:unnamed protein product [Calypogeia fissa]
MEKEMYDDFLADFQLRHRSSEKAPPILHSLYSKFLGIELEVPHLLSENPPPCGYNLRYNQHQELVGIVVGVVVVANRQPAAPPCELLKRRGDGQDFLVSRALVPLENFCRIVPLTFFFSL